MDNQLLIAVISVCAFALVAIGYVVGVCERSSLDDPSEHGERPL